MDNPGPPAFCAILSPGRSRGEDGGGLAVGEVTVTSLSNLRNEVSYGGGEAFVTDEPKEVGGEGAGPDPYTLLLAALGSCISMTLTMYARRKQWPLESVTVRLRQNRIHSKDCEADRKSVV